MDHASIAAMTENSHVFTFPEILPENEIFSGQAEIGIPRFWLNPTA